MTVLNRSELEASPLADLHVIADQIGLEGFRRLRKADLIGAILGEEPAEKSEDSTEDSTERPRRSRSRSRRGSGSASSSSSTSTSAKPSDDEEPAKARPSRRTRARSESSADDEPAEETTSRPEAGSRRNTRGRGEREKSSDPDRLGEGIVEILGNGSAFLRVEPPEPSDEDVYISAAQVRRCELVSGDRVTGPVRTPRRSERYPSLVRVDTINGDSADAVSEGTRYDDLPVAYPSERLTLDSDDPTLKAIEWLTPVGQGSRAVIVGGARSGKTEALRRIAGALAGRDGLELMVVLSGVRPEEVAEWQQGSVAPAVTLTFAASADAQGQAVETTLETAKRLVTRGGNAVVLIDSLDGLHPHSARKVLAAARNLVDGGSLTVIATATQPFGGETTVIALDAVRAGSGRLPALDLVSSGTLKPELLVGEDGAEEIARARAAVAS
jgi:transcription termination factor Rho